MQLLRRIPKSEGNQRLVVFHHAGGNGNQFVQFLKVFQQSFEIFVLDMPGRHFRLKEPALVDMQQVVDLVLQELKGLASLPTYYFGHSMGGLIAFEVCRQLHAAGDESTRRLGISSLLPPSLRRRNKVSELSDAEFLRVITEFAPLPAFLSQSDELLEIYVRVFRNDIRLMESYQVPPQIVLPISSQVFGGDCDKNVPIESLSEWHNWVQIEREPLIYPGGHFYLFEHFESAITALTKG